jgi:adenine-specific DNA-methyltransferase
MATNPETKLPLTSPDVNSARLDRLREIFPEAFTEGKIDFDKFQQVLSGDVTEAAERYGLTWTGKSEAIKNIQTLTTGTLLPARDESVNFDATENLIIEGDNLEVLKLLQGGYHGRVKMIYIDPPYNTGGDYIYPDNYKEGLADYLKFSGQVSGEGIKLTTNPETDGRYHSKWLTMIYPRLFLARNLLREDGVIFVIIDDHEAHNLRAVMNEIFGEENFVANLVWQSRTSISNDQEVSLNHNHTLCFSKERDLCGMKGKPLDESEYDNPDNDSRGPWKLVPIDANKQGGDTRYPITNPKTGQQYYPPGNRSWSMNPTDFKRLLDDKRIMFGLQGDSAPKRKLFLNERKLKADTKTPSSLLLDVGTTQDGTQSIMDLFGGEKLFQYPKSVGLLRRLCEFGLGNDDIVLDFFAGSGTTAQAVFELNSQDGGNRKFILVQLPEPTERKDFPTIADITKERVRRVIKKLSAAENQKRKQEKSELKLGDTAPARKLDLGFKVFKLSSSNFKVWDATSAPKDATGLAEQLKLMSQNVVENRGDEALLYEVILKSNLPLTGKIQGGKIGAQIFYDVADGALAICLERKLTLETLRGIIARKPRSVICLDIAFAGNDQLKTNIVLEIKSHGIEFHTA